jgi:undecaprenyl-diphosphatase
LTRTRRFALRSATGLGEVTVFGVGFGLLLVLVRTHWPPLRQLDGTVADRLNDLVADNEVVVNALTAMTNLGGTPMLLWLLTVGTAWLLIRRQPLLAAYVVVTALGAFVLNAVVKELVDRLRPAVNVPVAAAPGLSFPSGHALGSLVSYGVLLLVFLPVVPRAARRITTTVAVLVVVAIGLTRMALGVHYLTDVLAGWLLGLMWLVITTAAFRRWGVATPHRQAALTDGLAPDAAPALEPAPHPHPLPHPWRGATELLTAWVMLLGLLYATGQLIARGTAPAWDHGLVEWLVGQRTPLLNAVAEAAESVGSTQGVLITALVVAPLALAVTRDWRPALFLAVVMVGEITLFLASSSAVGRDRPDVVPLVPHLPPTSSFPSGHVSATCAVYAATALLVVTGTRRWWRWLAVVVAAVVIAAVALARLYYGVHYPTDVLGGLLLGLSWVAMCWWVIIRPTGADRPVRDRENSTPTERSEHQVSPAGH